MNRPPRILIAGIGNIFLGDDAFGVHVAQRLTQRSLPAHVRVIDFGIRGLDLVYTLLDGWDVAILIDAVPRGQPPGTLFLIEPEIPDTTDADLIEAHSMDPLKVLRTVRAMGGAINRMLIVGCEPTPIDPDADIQPDLSPQVAAAIEPAIEMIESLIIAQQESLPQTLEVHHARQICST